MNFINVTKVTDDIEIEIEIEIEIFWQKEI